MDERLIATLSENDREWRRYMIEQLEALRTDVQETKKWNFLFRVVGSGVYAGFMAILGIYVQWKFDHLN